jgi:hypothetical protein
LELGKTASAPQSWEPSVVRNKGLRICTKSHRLNFHFEGIYTAFIASLIVELSGIAIFELFISNLLIFCL